MRNRPSPKPRHCKCMLQRLVAVQELGGSPEDASSLHCCQAGGAGGGANTAVAVRRHQISFSPAANGGDERSLPICQGRMLKKHKQDCSAPLFLICRPAAHEIRCFAAGKTGRQRETPVAIRSLPTECWMQSPHPVLPARTRPEVEATLHHTLAARIAASGSFWNQSGQRSLLCWVACHSRARWPSDRICFAEPEEGARTPSAHPQALRSIACCRELGLRWPGAVLIDSARLACLKQTTCCKSHLNCYSAAAR